MTDAIDISLPLQKHILAAVLRVPGLMARTRTALNPDHYPDDSVADVMAWALHHWDEHAQLPSKAALLDVFKTDEDAQDVIKRAYKADIPDTEHIEDRVRGYAKHRALRLAVAEAARAVAAHGRGEVLKDDRNRPLYTDVDSFIRKKVEDAMLVGTDRTDIGVFLHEALDADVDRLLHPQVAELFTTGIQHLDEAGMSLERGEVGCVLGVSKGGKSQALLNIALHQLRQGVDVVWYNFEMRDTRARDRWYRRIAGSKVDLKTDPEAFVVALKERFPAQLSGKLLMKRAVSKTFTPAMMRAHQATIRDMGFKPALCIVDYVGIMRPEKLYDEMRFNLASLWLDFRAICQQYDMAGWSAAQSNRGGANAELLTMKDIAESFEIVQHIDVGFSISMTQAEREANQGKFFVFASRNERDGTIIDFTHDFSRSRMTSVGIHQPTAERRSRAGTRPARVTPGEESVDAVLQDDRSRRSRGP